MDDMRRGIAVLGVAVTVLASACGSSGSNGATTNTSAASLIAATSARTQGTGSARMALDISISGLSASSGASSFTEHGQGAFDFKSKEGQFSLSIPQLGNAGLTILFTPDALYEKVPSALGGALTGSKPWLKIDLSALGGLAAANPSLGGSSDPTQALNALLGASNDVRKLGTDTVRGTSTTHYHLTLDLSRAACNPPIAKAIPRVPCTIRRPIGVVLAYSSSQWMGSQSPHSIMKSAVAPGLACSMAICANPA